MAERKVIVELQLSDKNAVAELGRLQTETRQYQQSLKLLNSIVDENGKATNRQKQQIGELVAKIENNRVQYRELKNDISGATAAGLRFRDKMAEASLEALKQSGILGKLDAQQATLTQEVQKNTAVIAANEVAMKELRAEYQKGEFTTKEYKEQLKALKVESQAAEVANEKLGAELKDVSTQIGAMDAKVEALTADLKAGRITTEEFRRGVSSINDATNNAALSFDNGVKSLKAYALGFFGVVEGVQFLGRVVGDAIGTLRDQEKALSAVSSLGGEYEANIGRIAETTRTAGIAFGFTAVESTNAVEALAKAGVSVENILAGGLEGALTLAASGEVAVGDAAEYAAAAMSEFGLSGKDVTMIADTLTAAAVKAQGGVEDYGQALKFVGPVAAGLDVSLQETVGTLAEFAQAGVKGEQGGTSLRGVLSSLTSPSKAASEEMERLGIITAEGNNTLFDAQGKFKGLANLAERLRETTKDLTQEERAAAFGRIFGNQQLTAANILYKGGGKAIEEWTKQVTDSGLAAEIAAKKTDNLDGLSLIHISEPTRPCH
jgi:TP901 family phage tail tape measure protein